jgi:hypothetical protein
MPGYEVWTFHGDVGDVDRMDEMLEATQGEATEDPPTTEVETFFKLLKAS